MLVVVVVAGGVNRGEGRRRKYIVVEQESYISQKIINSCQRTSEHALMALIGKFSQIKAKIDEPELIDYRHAL